MITDLFHRAILSRTLPTACVAGTVAFAAWRGAAWWRGRVRYLDDVAGER